eukprot:ANDGO_05487.mRNA.1 Phosphatidylinositol 3-kinase 1
MPATSHRIYKLYVRIETSSHVEAFALTVDDAYSVLELVHLCQRFWSVNHAASEPWYFKLVRVIELVGKDRILLFAEDLNHPAITRVTDHHVLERVPLSREVSAAITDTSEDRSSKFRLSTERKADIFDSAELNTLVIRLCSLDLSAPSSWRACPVFASASTLYRDSSNSFRVVDAFVALHTLLASPPSAAATVLSKIMERFEMVSPPAEGLSFTESLFFNCVVQPETRMNILRILKRWILQSPDSFLSLENQVAGDRLREFLECIAPQETGDEAGEEDEQEDSQSAFRKREDLRENNDVGVFARSLLQLLNSLQKFHTPSIQSAAQSRVSGASSSWKPFSLDTAKVQTDAKAYVEKVIEQLTIMDWEFLSQVNSYEWTFYDRERLSDPSAKNICQCLRFWKNVQCWAVLSVLQEADYKSRASRLRLLLAVFRGLKLIRSYNMAFAIWAAIYHPSISRLSKTWESLRKDSSKELEEAEYFPVWYQRDVVAANAIEQPCEPRTTPMSIDDITPIYHAPLSLESAHQALEATPAFVGKGNVQSQVNVARLVDVHRWLYVFSSPESSPATPFGRLRFTKLVSTAPIDHILLSNVEKAGNTAEEDFLQTSAKLEPDGDGSHALYDRLYIHSLLSIFRKARISADSSSKSILKDEIKEILRFESHSQSLFQADFGNVDDENEPDPEDEKDPYLMMLKYAEVASYLPVEKYVAIAPLSGDMDLHRDVTVYLYFNPANVRDDPYATWKDVLQNKREARKFPNVDLRTPVRAFVERILYEMKLSEPAAEFMLKCIGWHEFLCVDTVSLADFDSVRTMLKKDKPVRFSLWTVPLVIFASLYPLLPRYIDPEKSAVDLDSVPRNRKLLVEQLLFSNKRLIPFVSPASAKKDMERESTRWNRAFDAARSLSAFPTAQQKLIPNKDFRFPASAVCFPYGAPGYGKLENLWKGAFERSGTDKNASIHTFSNIPIKFTIRTVSSIPLTSPCFAFLTGKKDGLQSLQNEVSPNISLIAVAGIYHGDRLLCPLLRSSFVPVSSPRWNESLDAEQPYRNFYGQSKHSSAAVNSKSLYLSFGDHFYTKTLTVANLPAGARLCLTIWAVQKKKEANFPDKYLDPSTGMWSTSSDSYSAPLPTGTSTFATEGGVLPFYLPVQGLENSPSCPTDLSASMRYTVEEIPTDSSCAPLGCVAIPLVDENGHLMQGSVTKHLWESHIAHPMHTTVESPDKMTITIDFEKYSDSPVVFPEVYAPQPNDLPLETSNNDPNIAQPEFRCWTDRPDREARWQKLRKLIFAELPGQSRPSDISAADKVKLDALLKAPPLNTMTIGECALVYKYRHYLLDKPHALIKFLMSVPWNDLRAAREAYALLWVWCPPSPLAALELLDMRFTDPHIRAYAIDCLNRLSNRELASVLLQLVQVLKYEAHNDSPLARFLVKRGAQSPDEVGHILFWHLKAELHVHTIAPRFGFLLEELLRNVGRSARIGWKRQCDMVRSLCDAAERVKGIPKNDRAAFLQADLVTICAKLGLKCSFSDESKRAQYPDIVDPSPAPTEYSLPLDPRMRVCGLRIDKCKCMDSKKVPLWLVFDNADPLGDPIYIIFKSGDDLRQDLLTLQMLRVMEGLWMGEGLDLKMNPYGCVATGDMEGMIEVVLNSDTSANITRTITGGAKGAFRKDTFDIWLRQQNPDSFDTAVENFKVSCAAYCVATYVLGIGDRHNDNIMLTKTGQLFHIDFGHFLGNIKRKFGVKRERAPFVFTPDFAYVFGGEGAKKYKEFEDMCVRVYQALRKHAAMLCNLFVLMLSTGIPELQQKQDIEYLQTALQLSMTDEEAAKFFKSLIRESLNSRATVLNNWAHLMAH